MKKTVPVYILIKLQLICYKQKNLEKQSDGKDALHIEKQRKEDGRSHIGNNAKTGEYGSKYLKSQREKTITSRELEDKLRIGRKHFQKIQLINDCCAKYTKNS